MKLGHYEDEYVSFDYFEGLLDAKYKIEKIDINIAKHILDIRLAHFNQSNYAVLVDYSIVKETTKEARDFFATPEATRYFTALAVVTDSMVGNMIYNFYIMLSKPPIPTKLFKDKDEALSWIKSLHL